MSAPTEEQIKKLPNWAQKHIEDLSRQRRVAINALKEWTDSQTPSKVRIREMVCLGVGGPDINTRYVQTEQLEILHAGIRLDISIYDSRSIQLKWTREDRSSGDVAMIPKWFQNVELVSKENLL